MLLSIVALVLGGAIGRARGGHRSALASLTLHRWGWLVAGITAVLVVNWIGPANPLVWMIAGYASFAMFGLRNLQLTGMIVMLIGLVMNAAAMIANGAVPVSERALRSVGAVDDTGAPLIEGIRESNETATSFGIFGDIVPLPLFDVVVSLGDLIIAVALADIAMNIWLRARTRPLDDAAYSYAEPGAANVEPNTAAVEPDRVPIESPISRTFLNRPAHAAHRRPRLGKLHRLHIPAHAAPRTRPDLPTIDDDTVIVLNDDSSEHAYIAQPPPPTGSPVAAPQPSTPAAGAVDTRPIIDLTTSPTDEQLCEFLRRRAEADAALKRRDDAGSSSTDPTKPTDRHGATRSSRRRGRNGASQPVGF